MKTKTVAAIHDLAGVGRSSLSVVMPILSAMGHQVCALPTCVFSTITGFFENYKMVDLTDEMPPIMRHWADEGLSFDCVYTGFLGSARQIEHLKEFIHTFRPALKVVDPVFADDGELYPIFDMSMVGAMRSLIKNADIITPNLTEAAFLLGEPLSSCESIPAAAVWAKRLSETGPRIVVITSAPHEDDSLSVVFYSADEERAWYVTNPYIHAHYPGTGDIFASVLTGAVLNDGGLCFAVGQAADFVFTAIYEALKDEAPPRLGVPLERLLPRLWENRRLAAIEIEPGI